jgi:hypothetical protein
MRTPLVVGVALICAAIGFGSVLLLPGSQPPPSPRSLLDRPASDIVSISMATGRADRIGAQNWTVSIPRGQSIRVPGEDPQPIQDGEASRSPAVVWAGDATRLRALSRLLAAASGTPGGTVAQGGPQAAIGFAGGQQITLRFDPTPLAGSVGVAIEGISEPWTTRVDAELADLFASGAQSWRSTAAFPDLPEVPARIELTAGDRSLVLDRLGSRWVLRSPVVADADVPMVSLMVRQLMALGGEQFADAHGEISSESDFARKPQLVCTVLDSRTGGRRWVVELLGPIDNARIAARCSVSDAEGNLLLGPVIMEIDPSKAERLDPDPTAYLTRKVLRVAPADIGGLAITSDTASASFVRTSEGWSATTDLQAAGQPEIGQADDSSGVEGLTRLLTETDAVLMLLSAQAGNGFSQRMTVRPVDRHGTPIVDVLRVGIYTAGGSGVARLGVESQGVLRIFDTSQAGEPWAWMQRALEPK